MLVCGDAGTGKSTFCRYLTNSLLNGYPHVALLVLHPPSLTLALPFSSPRYAQVWYLECDVGQSEFTVAGVIALHLLTQPVFGPPYTHPRQPYKYVLPLP